MPIEAAILDGMLVPLLFCPHCDAGFQPFLRGQVQRRFAPTEWGWWQWLFRCNDGWPYCALICWQCKQIVGYEGLLGEYLLLRRYR